MERRTNSPTQPTDAPSLDTIFALLSDHRRRSVVAVLSEREPPIALPELVTAVASRELEAESNDTAAESLETVGAALRHVHLPKLDDAGVVDYDAESNVVTAVRTEELTMILRRSEDAQ